MSENLNIYHGSFQKIVVPPCSLPVIECYISEEGSCDAGILVEAVIFFNFLMQKGFAGSKHRVYLNRVLKCKSAVWEVWEYVAFGIHSLSQSDELKSEAGLTPDEPRRSRLEVLCLVQWVAMDGAV